MKSLNPMLRALVPAISLSMALSMAGLPAIAVAQPAAPDAAPAPDCGTWQSGTWVPSGACGANDYRSHVAGTVTAVKGHLVTLQQSTQSMVINDQPALERQDTGKVAVGRQVYAVGYWRSGTFYATSLHTVAPAGPAGNPTIPAPGTTN